MKKDMLKFTRFDVYNLTREEINKILEGLPQRSKIMARYQEKNLNVLVSLALEELSRKTYIDDHDHLYLKTKDDLIKAISYISENKEKYFPNITKRNTESLNHVLDSFIGVIKSSDLIDGIPEGWGFIIKLTPYSIELHTGEYAKIDLDYMIDNLKDVTYETPAFRTEFLQNVSPVIIMELIYISLEDYCEVNNLKTGVVKKQLEDHFLKDACMIDNQWYVYPFAKVCSEEDIDVCCYIWRETLPVPEKFAYLNDYSEIVAVKMNDGYRAMLFNKDKENNIKDYTNEEYFELEDLLIKLKQVRVGHNLSYDYHSIACFDKKEDLILQ